MISVIIPLYNSEATIVKALDSVKNQTYGKENFEVIVVDDGSTDHSFRIVENYIGGNPEMNIQLIHQENKGVSAARNAALKIASGNYIAFLDSDDEWLPQKTERQMEFLNNENLKIDFLATRRNGLRILFPYRVDGGLAKITFKRLLIRNEAQPSAVIFKKKVIDDIGFFDENQRYAEDMNYWMKISKNQNMYILDESLVIAGNGKITFGESGLSANLYEMQKGFQKNLKDMFVQKRINRFQQIIYYVFYKAKYVLLLFRKSIR